MSLPFTSTYSCTPSCTSCTQGGRVFILIIAYSAGFSFIETEDIGADDGNVLSKVLDGFNGGEISVKKGMLL